MKKKKTKKYKPKKLTKWQKKWGFLPSGYDLGEISEKDTSRRSDYMLMKLADEGLGPTFVSDLLWFVSRGLLGGSGRKKLHPATFASYKLLYGQEGQEKMEEGRNNLQEKHYIKPTMLPHHYKIIRKGKQRLKYLHGLEVNKYEKGELEKTLATLAIIGLLVGIFFLSPNLTGNTIANLNLSSTNLILGIIFVFGLVAGLFYFISRKK